MILLILPTQYEFNILKFILPEDLNGKIIMQSPGMGKLRTLGCLYETLHKYPSIDWVILAGYCGSLDKKELPMGKLIEVNDFIEGDFDAGEFEDRSLHRIIRDNGDMLGQGFKPCRMISQDQFIQTNPYSKEFSLGSATDMEAYAVAKFCTAHEIKYSVVKVVSDVVGKNSEDLFKKMAVELADNMNEQITLALVAIKDALNENKN